MILLKFIIKIFLKFLCHCLFMVQKLKKNIFYQLLIYDWKNVTEIMFVSILLTPYEVITLNISIRSVQNCFERVISNFKWYLILKECLWKWFMYFNCIVRHAFLQSLFTNKTIFAVSKNRFLKNIMGLNQFIRLLKATSFCIKLFFFFLK